MTTPQPQPSPQDSPFPQASAQPSSSPSFTSQSPYAQPFPAADAPPPFPNTPTPPSFAPAYGNTAGALGAFPTPQASADDRTWAIFAHLSAAIASLVSVGGLSFLGPLIIYLVKKDTSPFVRQAAGGAFNFALSMTLVSIAGLLLTFTVVGAIVGIPLIFVGWLLPIILGIVGAVKTSSGTPYTYPFQLKVLN